ncbi:hypothetical protein ACN23B_18985 [Anabaena sp. FACHB-709]|uniref:Uncharacterized protein n=2 Tax=Nostocaceae TaxID=1162 RepID=A0A1Z4KKC0_ANAVA|nr:MULTISPECIES: hypothetical protein [Nostocaceae]BAY69407.1 hypothetical protein NIES23_22010 [Trichormus variabilis NIES-23]MBD2171124.1 hypothetical protein [Anabaena cylindrica FACHB-318]MBD2262904.1 hypothetical protein [Anabaena sp. FACHB-709]MBD2272299.1 hypothetical protein [Nostoc sp. PCC 7120 = FACHB-418]MBD2283503.1 hypothetical protein [Anabaena cylindrica FACHB-170]
MEPVTLTAVGTAIATIVLTKALEKTGEKLGEAALEKSNELIAKLRQKNKLPLLANTSQEDTQQALDYGQAVLELKAAADKDTEIAQSVREVEATINQDKSPKAEEIQKLSAEIQAQPAIVNNFAKLAESIQAEKGAMVAQQITIQEQHNTYN